MRNHDNTDECRSASKRSCGLDECMEADAQFEEAAGTLSTTGCAPEYCGFESDREYSAVAVQSSEEDQVGAKEHLWQLMSYENWVFTRLAYVSASGQTLLDNVLAIRNNQKPVRKKGHEWCPRATCHILASEESKAQRRR